MSDRTPLPINPLIPPPGYRDVSIPMQSLARPGLMISIFLAALALVPFWMIHGFKGSLDFTFDTVLIAAVTVVALMFAHELLHGVGWMLSGQVKRDQVSFHFDRRTFSPYAHASTPMSARAYRLGGVLPVLMTGALPILIGWITGSGIVTLVGAFMLVGAVGDLIILWVIRDVPGSTLVIDHPRHAGCWVQDLNPSKMP